MKSKIFVGVEFIIFLLLLGAVIIYSQVLIKKVIDRQASEALELQVVKEEQKTEVVATSTNEKTFSTEEKYQWLIQQESVSPTATSTSEMRAYLKQASASSSSEKTMTTEEKMKFLEQKN